MTTERFEVVRQIAADPATVFAVLCDPNGHVSIDSSGMLQSAEGEPVRQAGDTFLVHMDREALNDNTGLHKYDVTVLITEFEPDALIEWTVAAPGRGPSIGHRYGYRVRPSAIGAEVTSFYDWSRIPQAFKDSGRFPVIPESALRASLGILARTVENPA